MEKLVKYSLSIVLTFLFSCGPVEQPSSIPIDQEIARLDSLRKLYHQGTEYSQVYFDSLISLAPTNEYYYREKSVAHTKIGDYHIAFPLLEKSAQLDPKESLYYYSWLLLYYYRDYDRALLRLEEYDALSPGFTDSPWGENIHFLKGLAHKQKGDYKKAIQEFDLSIATDGYDYADPYTFVYRAICFLNTGAYEKAKADLELFISLEPNTVMPYYYMAQYYIAQNNKEKAKQHLAIAATQLALDHHKTDPYMEVFDAVQEGMIADSYKRLEGS